MSSFPALHTGPMQQAKVACEGRFSHYFVLQGHTGDIRPGGLPAPAWMVAVNPNGFDDAEQEAFDLGECFNGDPDGSVLKIVGVSKDVLKAALLDQAARDAADHVECDNGGLYAVWELPDALVVGGFDNGGSDIAQTAARDVVNAVGAKVLLEGDDSHFQLEVLRHKREEGSLYGGELGAVQIAEELLSWQQRQEIDENTVASAGQGPGARL